MLFGPIQFDRTLSETAEFFGDPELSKTRVAATRTLVNYVQLIPAETNLSDD